MFPVPLKNNNASQEMHILSPPSCPVAHHTSDEKFSVRPISSTVGTTGCSVGHYGWKRAGGFPLNNNPMKQHNTHIVSCTNEYSARCQVNKNSNWVKRQDTNHIIRRAPFSSNTILHPPFILHSAPPPPTETYILRYILEEQKSEIDFSIRQANRVRISLLVWVMLI